MALSSSFNPSKTSSSTINPSSSSSSNSVSIAKNFFQQKIDGAATTASATAVNQTKPTGSSSLAQNVSVATTSVKAQATQTVVVHLPSNPLQFPKTTSSSTQKPAPSSSSKTPVSNNNDKTTNVLEAEVFMDIKELRSDKEISIKKIEVILEKLVTLCERNPNKKESYQALFSIINTCFVEKSMPTSANEKALYVSIINKYGLPQPKNLKEVVKKVIDNTSIKLLNSSSPQELFDKAADIKSKMEHEKSKSMIKHITQSSPAITEKIQRQLIRLVDNANMINLSKLNTIAGKELSSFFNNFNNSATPKMSVFLDQIINFEFSEEDFTVVLNKLIDSPEILKLKGSDLNKAMGSIIEGIVLSKVSENNSQQIRFIQENYANIEYAYNQDKDKALEEAIPNFRGICDNALFSDANKLLEKPILKSTDFFQPSLFAMETQKMESSQGIKLKKDDVAASQNIARRPCTCYSASNDRTLKVALDNKDDATFLKFCPISGLIKSLKSEYTKTPKNFIANMTLSHPSGDEDHAIGIQLDAETNTYRFFDINAMVASYATADECINKLGEYLNVFYPKDAVPYFDVLTRKS